MNPFIMFDNPIFWWRLWRRWWVYWDWSRNWKFNSWLRSQCNLYKHRIEFTNTLRETFILDGPSKMVENIVLSISFIENEKEHLRQFWIVNSWIQEEVSHVLVMSALPTVVFQMGNNVGHHNFLNSMKFIKWITINKFLCKNVCNKCHLYHMYSVNFSDSLFSAGLHGRIFVHLSTFSNFSWSVVRIRPWGGQVQCNDYRRLL